MILRVAAWLLIALPGPAWVRVRFLRVTLTGVDKEKIVLVPPPSRVTFWPEASRLVSATMTMPEVREVVRVMVPLHEKVILPPTARAAKRWASSHTLMVVV